MSLLTKTSDVNGKKRINQFGDYDDTSNMTCTHWNDRWRKGQTQFHMPKVHPMLIKHIDRLTDGKTNLRFFVPLCGKTMDLNWLLERGHEVVGCDCSEEGCKEIFKRHNISYKTEYKANVRSTVLQGTDKKLSLYVGDYFDLQRKELGEFDCIWDRGSLVAVPVSKRQEYADIILSTMTNETKYLLDCFLVDNGIFGGPPFDCQQNQVEEYFGKQCKVEKIDVHDAFTEWQASWKLKTFVEEVYLIRLK